MRLFGADDYRNRGFGNVPGWMHILDLELFDMVLAHQLATETPGHLLEIGSFHGKSAIVLGYGLRADEQLTVCDIFGDVTNVPLEGTDPYDGLTADAFIQQYKRFHKKAPDVRSMPSSQLVLDQPYRFIHVDGGHAYEVVRDDINLVVRHASPGAVIALDDYRTVHTPGTSAAVWEAACNRTIYPFLVSEVKLYAATTKRDQLYWRDVCRQWDFPQEEHEIFGSDIVRVWK